MSARGTVEWVCDNCKRQQNDSQLPDFWYQVEWAGMAHTPAETWHLCGRKCFQAWAAAGYGADRIGDKP